MTIFTPDKEIPEQEQQQGQSHFMRIKESADQDHITILNANTPAKKSSKWISQNRTVREVNISIITIRDLNISLQYIGNSCKFLKSCEQHYQPNIGLTSLEYPTLQSKSHIFL